MRVNSLSRVRKQGGKVTGALTRENDFALVLWVARLMRWAGTAVGASVSCEGKGTNVYPSHFTSSSFGTSAPGSRKQSLLLSTSVRGSSRKFYSLISLMLLMVHRREYQSIFHWYSFSNILHRFPFISSFMNQRDFSAYFMRWPSILFQACMRVDSVPAIRNTRNRGESAALGHFSDSIFLGKSTIKNQKTNVVASQYNSLALL